MCFRTTQTWWNEPIDQELPRHGETSHFIKDYPDMVKRVILLRTTQTWWNEPFYQWLPRHGETSHFIKDYPDMVKRANLYCRQEVWRKSENVWWHINKMPDPIISQISTYMYTVKTLTTVTPLHPPPPLYDGHPSNAVKRSWPQGWPH